MENEKLPVEALTVQQAKVQSAANPNTKAEEMKNFFRDDFLKITRSIFTEPIKGTLGIFNNAGSNAYGHALILLATTALIYTIIPYFMMDSHIREYAGFSSFLKLGLSVSLVLLIISALSFGIKAVSGKPDFKKELLTGALCGIPLMIFIAIVALFSVFGTNSIRDFSPQSLLDMGLFLGMITLYIMLMLFNIVQQSFKASGTNDALSWYLSPLVISSAFYIGIKIAMGIFGPSGYNGNVPF